MTTTTRSATKRKRQEEAAALFSTVPDEILRRVFSYSDRRDFLGSLPTVCRQWFHILQTSPRLWKQLAGRCHPVVNSMMESIVCPSLTVAPEPPWRKLFLQREKQLLHGAERTEELNSDLHQPCLDSFELEVCIWFSIKGQCETQRFRKKLKEECTVADHGAIQFALPANMLRDDLTSVSALEIKICSAEGIAVLYSSGVHTGSFESFGFFEKFAITSWFHGYPHDPDNAVGLHIRAGLPVVKPYITVGDDGGEIEIQMQWLKTYGHLYAMSKPTIPVFLQRGMVFKEHVEPQEQAQLPPLIRSQPPSYWCHEGYSPRPLSSYSFLVDFYIDLWHAGSSTISHFYESAELTHEYRGTLKFPIPERFRQSLPEGANEDNLRLVARDAVVVVHIIDRSTGKQAKLYSGSAKGIQYHSEGHVLATDTYLAFQRFSTSLYFLHLRDEQLSLVPATNIRLYDDEISTEFELNLVWLENTRDEYRSEYMRHQHVLAFFEKGLEYA